MSVIVYNCYWLQEHSDSTKHASNLVKGLSIKVLFRLYYVFPSKISNSREISFLLQFRSCLYAPKDVFIKSLFADFSQSSRSTVINHGFYISDIFHHTKDNRLALLNKLPV